MQLLKMVKMGLVCTSLAVLAVTVVGCDAGAGGPDLVPVSGTVTLGGAPLANASVTFKPTSDAGGSSAIGRTDSNGKYSLAYSLSRTGCENGEFAVEISTADESDDGELVPETVPAIYNVNSELTVTVPSDSYDFALEAGGEIIQPDSGDDDDDDDSE